MSEIRITAENFESEVLGSSLPVFVDFYADWCGPCRMLAPEIEALASELVGVAKVCKLNVDDLPEIASRYGISSIPTVLLFKNGEVAGKNLGYCKRDTLKALL